MLLAFTGGGGRTKPELPASLTASKTVADPTDATASISFNADGTITDQDSGALGNWVNKPATVDPTDFRVKYDWTTGLNLTAYPAGASDDVYTTDISSTQTFSVARTTIGTRESGGTFTVEKISTGETATVSATFYAEVTS